ncbi:A/G-specific adenine glycosylase [Thiohalomonas denitrificans]|uniref:A/G-specific adenine glycosylase n=1 Tax=Thiohalomonas denitrificans TaxID=415747 RepID=UPI0026ECE9C4|nr:A/G-specific adenine glycosylase [Thiohalomonas denitrificans]
MDAFARRLLAWFDQYGRTDLPWQRERTPYRVWVSEIMLQQTRVATVIPYFERFTERFPTLAQLAEAEPDEVLAFWSGLGYYSRARNLHSAARQVAAGWQGELPERIDDLMALPGIGRSTAGAILAQSLGQRQPILDGNAKRVLARYHAVDGWPGRTAVQRQLWEWAETHTPHSRIADYTQAIMDLGATLCTRGRPDCEACPLGSDCQARQAGTQARYPEPKPRKTLPLRNTTMLIAQDANGRLLLWRRPPTGIWGGLWSLPEHDPDESLFDWCRESLGLKVSEPTAGPEITHTFSHFRLTISTVLCRAKTATEVKDRGDFSWDLPEELFQRGLPAPVRRLLEAVTEPVG